MKKLTLFFFAFTFLCLITSSLLERDAIMKIGELTGDKGRTTGHQAVDGVIDHELSASPQNYELWLHYAMGAICSHVLSYKLCLLELYASFS